MCRLLQGNSYLLEILAKLVFSNTSLSLKYWNVTCVATQKYAFENCFTVLPYSIIISFVSQAQTFDGLDKSPMDMAYFPHNFAHDRKEGQKAVIRVVYSRPAKNGRDVSVNSFPTVKSGAQEPMKRRKLNFIRILNSAGKK
jgi:hypothetical protein